MTTTQQERVTLSNIIAAAIVGGGGLLMIVGLTGIADESQYNRALEVLTEFMAFGGMVLGYWFGKKAD